MDLTETFERLFTGKHFTSDAEFEQACEDFKKVNFPYSVHCHHRKRVVDLHGDMLFIVPPH